MKPLIFTVSVILGLSLASTPAWSHPHDNETETQVDKKRNWPFFGKKDQSPDERSDRDEDFMSAEEFSDAMGDTMKKHSETLNESVEKFKDKLDDGRTSSLKSKEDIVEKARQFEDALGEADIFSTLASVMMSMSEDFDVENEDDNMVLRFDGKKLGQVSVQRDHEKEESFNLEGFGQSLRLNRESYKKDGKSKTRIVIEIENDTGDDTEFEFSLDEGDEL